MPLILLVVGALFVTSAVRNTHADLFSLLKSDFTGDQNFVVWIIAIFVAGALGYVPGLRPLSYAFLLLIVAVIVLTNAKPGASGGGFFAEFTTALKATTQTGS